nr:hypothetical protein [Tanacetum cinerariifolium]
MASALICLSSGQRINFSKYIFESLVRSVDSTSKFYMYPRAVDAEEEVQVVAASVPIPAAKPAAKPKVAAASVPIPAAKPAAKPKVLKIAAALAVSTRKRKGVTREEMEKEDEEIIKIINETPAQKATKRRKLSEEAQEADDLRGRLEIVVVIDNKPKYKIIRADDTYQFYISFTTLLKNFDRKDLETSWRIVKDRFSTKKPTNYLDEYLLLTLKTIFGEPDEQDAIWRNQKSVHGLALVKRWKLLTSCGVHVIILSTVQLFLLVERRYPLSRFTLEQLVNVARLQVEEESEMSLELLRFTRHQLLEYQQG